MSKVGAVLLSDKSRVTISLSTLVVVLIFTATLTYNLYSMKTNMDLSINSLEKDQVRIEQKFDDVVFDLKEADGDIISDQKEISSVVLEVKTQLSGIQTDLKWIISNMDSK